MKRLLVMSLIPKKNNADGSKETKGNTVKKLKTKKTLVVLESSEDET